MASKAEEREMKLRVDLLKAHQEFMCCMEELCNLYVNNIRPNANQFLYGRAAGLVDRLKPAVELLSTNINNNF